MHMMLVFARLWTMSDSLELHSKIKFALKKATAVKNIKLTSAKSMLHIYIYIGGVASNQTILAGA